MGWNITLILLLLTAAIILLFIALWMRKIVRDLSKKYRQGSQPFTEKTFTDQLQTMKSDQLNDLLQYFREKKKNLHGHASILLLLIAGLIGTLPAQAQESTPVPIGSAMPGIVITIVLIFIPVAFALVFLALKIRKTAKKYENTNRMNQARNLAAFVKDLPAEENLEQEIEHRKTALNFRLTNTELGGVQSASDDKGILRVKGDPGLPIVGSKQKALPRSTVDPRLSYLILGYLITATFWLLFGTTIGEYIGIKFVAPDADHISWLSFGRLRPVHTNSVFWGWASLGMLGLGYYVVPRVSNVRLYSFKLGWYTLYLINAAVLLGSISLMAGINNGGGEYREYIWPIMALFGIGLILTLYNYLKTVALRKTTEIYVSNWYIISAVMFVLVIAFVAYWPSWQMGLGETIVQGYYMHQGVGMWFMLFTLGLVYYYLPQHLNRPIYSYSLGILAFWTQIMFYTLIGTHHFIFSSIPWWLQTVAIFGSVGMVIPVVAGTTNFLMTFRHGWFKLTDSYTLPFFLVGTIFYFTGSMQGTAEAFRSTNLFWHFTDFTVAHSHLTMYGIISFYIWACVYTVVPRLTQNEAPQITIGAHFWLALIGLLFYTVPLMYGATMKGKLWMEGKPFIDGVVLMEPYWLWRAIGGTLMWTSHLFFAYNLYKMLPTAKAIDVNEKAIEILKESTPAAG
jgi:cytochrome c oxidase cbb3-type subunit 1